MNSKSTWRNKGYVKYNRKNIIHAKKKFKMKQSNLSKRLEFHNCYVKPNSISFWETRASIPNATQSLTTFQIMGLTDIYETFIGISPSNPLGTLSRIQIWGHTPKLDAYIIKISCSFLVLSSICIIHFINSLALHSNKTK